MVAKATPKAKTHKTKALTPPPIKSTQAHLLHQSVKVQEVDLQRKEVKVIIQSRMTPAAAVVRRVRVEERVEGRETEHSQKFTSTRHLKRTLTVTR